MNVLITVKGLILSENKKNNFRENINNGFKQLFNKMNAY